MKPDDRISEILKATRHLLSEKGFENVTTLEIARHCGISEAALFKYFPTKRELLSRVAEIWFEEIINNQTNEQQNQTIYLRLRQLIGESLSIIKYEPSLSRYILMELRPDSDYRSMYIYRLNKVFTGHIIDILNDAVASGEFRGDISLSLLRNVIFGGIEHQTWAYLRGEGDFDLEQAADGISNLVYQGMASSPVGKTSMTTKRLAAKKTSPAKAAVRKPASRTKNKAVSARQVRS